ncbi:MAG: hypothetical protein U0838_07980 [Chloroflexota bacterium]
MSLTFLTVFFAVCVFVYQPKPEPKLRAWAVHLALCLAVGWVIAAVLLSLGVFSLPGIDPNAGQHM